MDISVFGLGYVGVVAAGCLAADGHRVIGVDPSAPKLALIGRGVPPIVEKDVDRLIESAVESGRLRATADARAAVLDSEISLVCVGTPSQLNGALDLRYVRAVCEQIGAALAEKEAFHVVVARSTMLPGTMRDVVIPTLEEASGKRAGRDFGVCVNPEFLREGTAVHDYRHPPKTVVGATDDASAERLVVLYGGLDAPLVRTTVR